MMCLVSFAPFSLKLVTFNLSCSFVSGTEDYGVLLIRNSSL